jgi:hypothetical protein
MWKASEDTVAVPDVVDHTHHDDFAVLLREALENRQGRVT